MTYIPKHYRQYLLLVDIMETGREIQKFAAQSEVLLQIPFHVLKYSTVLIKFVLRCF